MPKADYQARVSAAKENVTSASRKPGEQEQDKAAEKVENHNQRTSDSQPTDAEQHIRDISQEPTQTIHNPLSSSPPPEAVADQTTRTAIVSASPKTSQEKGVQPYVVTPARLADNSRAAAAQRLSDQPDKV